ncbi:OmpA family protein [Geothermobacter ehrlichii]|uniref:OmpA family protein n=1 Tax=Geothermobacter ehrlichii TaxID=213224 RepID=A0A5D3WP51_9BACT|nr:OmpA family protein [Geothermobacter ehrlichii]TYP00332.1 OmpA family protein [Geothermobacter ehrlichii]
MILQRLVIKFIQAGVAFLFLYAGLALAAGDIDFADFIGTRRVLATVHFAPGSSRLDAVGRQTLDQLVEELRRLSPDEKVVRIEGFASPEGTERTNVDLSMERATRVELYFRRHHKLPPTRYLVGIGVRAEGDMPPEKQRRVEIAVYDNVLHVDWDKADRIIIDGDRK